MESIFETLSLQCHEQAEKRMESNLSESIVHFF